MSSPSNTDANAGSRALVPTPYTLSDGIDGSRRSFHKLYIKHHVPGRLRVTIPRAVGRKPLLDGYGAAFSTLPGVRKLSGSEVTGSIVIHYDKDLQDRILQDFLQVCSDHFLMVNPLVTEEVRELSQTIAKEAAYLSEHSEIAKRTMAFFNSVDLELKVVSSNTIDLNIALVGSLAVFALMGIGATAATPMWVTLALYGINHAVRLQTEGLSKAPGSGHSAAQSL